MSVNSKHVVVVGCGVIGACSAYYLRKAGWNVSMLDQGGFGSGCSHANCGLVSPSHALPLTMPGAARKALPTMFSRKSPLYIKPRLDPALWRWLWRFARRCEVEPMLEAARGRDALLRSSRMLYEELLETENLDCEWQTEGSLFVFEDAYRMDAYAEVDRWLSEFGLTARRYDGEALCEFEPALKPGLAGAWYYEIDAHLRPNRLMAELKRVLESMDVSICEQTEVRGVVCRSQRAAAVSTTKGEFAADSFVIATGAWTPQLHRKLGVRVPIQPGKGYSMTMPRPEVCPRVPLLLQEAKVAVTPLETGYRLGSTMEFSGYDTSLNPARLEALKSGAARYLRQPHCEPVSEEWYGWRPMTCDGRPYIDVGGLNNVYVAAGHNMLGLSMGPATGKLVAELVTGSTPHLDPGPYSLRRVG